jgi:hypothetical protein
MGKLIYSPNVSLDGYVETPDHGLDWVVIDEEVHTWFNDQLRGLDASLYGRRREPRYRLEVGRLAAVGSERRKRRCRGEEDAAPPGKVAWPERSPGRCD